MGQTITVMATDPAYSAMMAAATEALKPENLRIAVRGQNNRKEQIIPIERYGLCFYITGVMEGATAYKGSYTCEDLKAAIANMEQLAVIGSMFDILDGGGRSIDDWEYDGEPMTVLTTRDQINGAGLIFCDSVLQKIYGKIGKFYLLPSSIHELIVVPVSCGIDRGELKEMVMEVNRNEVSPEDRLSDEVYLFDGILRRE